jgi:hypothetical protein
MAWRSVVAGLALAWVAAAEARHSNAVLDPRRATPGVSLDLVELAHREPGDAPKYRLRVTGLPAGPTFGVWTRSFGRDFVEIVSGLRPDASGMLAVADRGGVGQRLDDMELDPGPYPRGAAWWVAIASEDHQVAAFARVVPYPITARDGSCSISLELISLHGGRFIALGEGFPPGEDVDIESRASGTMNRRRERVPPDGRLPLDVVTHGTLDGHTLASYAVKGRACAPAVEYRWGESALKVR